MPYHWRAVRRITLEFRDPLVRLEVESRQNVLAAGKVLAVGNPQHSVPDGEVVRTAFKRTGEDPVFLFLTN